MKKTLLYFSVLFFCASALILSSCSKSSDSDPAEDADDTTPTLSSFAATLSEDLVLASPTAQASTRRASYKKDVNAMSVPDADGAASEKVEALEELLAATAPASCNIAITIASSGNSPCYGPSVNYTSHSFDSSSGSWPGGDLGIWEEATSGGEACIAAQLTSRIKGAASLIDMAQFISAGIACVANKESLTLPGESAELDLTAELAGVVTVNATALTVTTATLEREANDGDGNPVYVTTLVGTAGSSTVNIRVKHISTSTDDATNKGKISVKYVTGSSADGASLEYEKASATSATMLLKTINFSNNTGDPFVSTTNQTVDFSKAWNNNANYLLASFNPVDYSGTFAYAWQAGNGDSHTRVFNAKITNDAGAITGSTFFGFGPRVQVGAGAISGMICAWTGPDQTHTPVNEVQRQNIEMSSGKFIVSGTSYTVFDPVANCEAGGAMSMSWNSGGSTRAANATTENLAPIAEVSTVIGTLPTAPDNVDL